jgi:hypothetical protein
LVCGLKSLNGCRTSSIIWISESESDDEDGEETELVKKISVFPPDFFLGRPNVFFELLLGDLDRLTAAGFVLGRPTGLLLLGVRRRSLEKKEFYS